MVKDSYIEYVGLIPEHWKVLNNKYVMKKEKTICEHWNGEPVLSLSMYGVFPRDLENPTGKMPATFDGYQYVEPEELLMCLFDIDVTPRCIGKVKQRGVTSPAYSRFRLYNNAYVGYYYYYYLMLDDTKELLHLAKNLRHSFTEEQLGMLKVPVPPFEEQKAIADYLDRECQRIDSAIEKTKASIVEYRKLKQALITQVVFYGLIRDRELKDSGTELIETIPVEWNVSRIKYIAEFQPKCSTEGLTDDSIIEYTPMECIKNGYYIPNTSRLGDVSASLTPYQEGDIVLAKVTPCFENGNVAIMNNLESGYGLGSSELFVLRPMGVVPKYLLYWLQNEIFVQQGCSTMTGTGGLKRVSPYFVKNSDILLPPISEQIEISEYLDKKCQEIDSLVLKKETFLHTLEEYKHSLIYEYVTGKKEVPHS